MTPVVLYDSRRFPFILGLGECLDGEVEGTTPAIPSGGYVPNKTTEREDPRRELFKKVWDLIGAGSAYSAIVAAAAYAMGYLVLRYQHNTLGIATDPPLIDERYLFAGARFLINVIIALANIMLVLLVLSVICFLIYHALPESA